jgi:hypothetical protein
MITCYLRYVIDPDKISDFEAYGQMWIPLVEKFGGTHHGYFLPHEGASNIAVALFSFLSLAAYEKYRIDSQHDPACQEAYELARRTKCIVSYERSFMRPVLGDIISR